MKQYKYEINKYKKKKTVFKVNWYEVSTHMPPLIILLHITLFLFLFLLLLFTVLFRLSGLGKCYHRHIPSLYKYFYWTLTNNFVCVYSLLTWSINNQTLIHIDFKNYNKLQTYLNKTKHTLYLFIVHFKV